MYTIWAGLPLWSFGRRFGGRGVGRDRTAKALHAGMARYWACSIQLTHELNSRILDPRQQSWIRLYWLVDISQAARFWRTRLHDCIIILNSAGWVYYTQSSLNFNKSPIQLKKLLIPCQNFQSCSPHNISSVSWPPLVSCPAHLLRTRRLASRVPLRPQTGSYCSEALRKPNLSSFAPSQSNACPFSVTVIQILDVPSPLINSYLIDRGIPPP